MRATACITAVLGVFLAGCGGDGADTPSTASGTTTTSAAAAIQTARFAFTARDALEPQTLTVSAAAEVRLEVVSEDGAPHGVVIRTPAGRVRLLVAPGGQGTAILRGLQAGRRYRLVPDGATEPVTLQVR